MLLLLSKLHGLDRIGTMVGLSVCWLAASLMLSVSLTCIQAETQYGVEIPNRIFVGGIAFDVRPPSGSSVQRNCAMNLCPFVDVQTTELELKNFFQTFGIVRDSKIITDRQGVSKG